MDDESSPANILDPFALVSVSKRTFSSSDAGWLIAHARAIREEGILDDALIERSGFISAIQVREDPLPMLEIMGYVITQDHFKPDGRFWYNNRLIEIHNGMRVWRWVHEYVEGGS